MRLSPRERRRYRQAVLDVGEEGMAAAERVLEGMRHAANIVLVCDGAREHIRGIRGHAAAEYAMRLCALQRIDKETGSVVRFASSSRIVPGYVAKLRDRTITVCKLHQLSPLECACVETEDLVVPSTGLYFTLEKSA